MEHSLSWYQTLPFVVQNIRFDEFILFDMRMRCWPQLLMALPTKLSLVIELRHCSRSILPDEPLSPMIKGGEVSSVQSGDSVSHSSQTRKMELGLHSRLTQLLPEPLVLLLYALVIGLVGGYGAVGFRKLIDVFTSVFFTGGIHVLSWMGRADVLFLPMIGLLIVSMIVKWLAPEAKGHGVPEVMAAIAEQGSIIRPRVAAGQGCRIGAVYRFRRIRWPRVANCANRICIRIDARPVPRPA